MAGIPPSHKEKVVALDEPQAVPVKPDQSGNENTAIERDVHTVFEEAMERIAKRTPEEREKHCRRLG